MKKFRYFIFNYFVYTPILILFSYTSVYLYMQLAHYFFYIHFLILNFTKNNLKIGVLSFVCTARIMGFLARGEGNCKKVELSLLKTMYEKIISFTSEIWWTSHHLREAPIRTFTLYETEIISIFKVYIKLIKRKVKKGSAMIYIRTIRERAVKV